MEFLIVTIHSNDSSPNQAVSINAKHLIPQSQVLSLSAQGEGGSYSVRVTPECFSSLPGTQAKTISTRLEIHKG